MQKNISIRRTAQKLVKAGQFMKAIEAYGPILTSGDVDPYDRLYVGDLHVKIGERKEAIAHYVAAIHEYRNLGFFRNAIALCRKILRLDPEQLEAYRFLGHLYASEELLGDALDAYFMYLENVSEETWESTEYRETLSRVLDLATRKTGSAVRLSKLLERMQRGDEAAEMLLRAAAVAEKTGNTQDAADLKARAAGLDPTASDRVGPQKSEISAPPSGAQLEGDPDAPGLEEHGEVTAGTEGLEVGLSEMDAEDPEADALDPGALGLTASAGQSPSEADQAGDVQPSRTQCEDPLTYGEIDPDRVGKGEGATGTRAKGVVATPDQPETVASGSGEMSSAEAPDTSAKAVAADGKVEKPDDDPEALPAHGLVDPAQATHKAIEAAQWTSAQKYTEEWIRRDALSVEAVEKLIEISEVLQDNPAIVRGLILQGDLLIRDGSLEGALPVFRRALEIDPENATAQRRMKRFQELGLDSGQSATGTQDASCSKPASPEADNPGLVQQVLEARDAVVTVREDSKDGDKEQQGWMDIGALLEEFHEGLRDQFDRNDTQALYDLAVSHMEMELLEEAIDKFDEALGCADVPAALNLRIRELRAKCFSKLERHREAIYELQLALESSKMSPEESAGLRYMLAVEYQFVGELDAAKECLREVLQAKPNLKEAAQLLSSMDDGAA